MLTLNIQTHRPDTAYDVPHFFIQSKGYNAGRPSAKPASNSYVLLASDEVEKGMLFWICYGLWKTNRFIPFLKGSGFPLLEIPDAGMLIDRTCKKITRNPGQFIADVKELKELIQTEKLLSAQIEMIKHIKKSVVRKMIR